MAAPVRAPPVSPARGHLRSGVSCLGLSRGGRGGPASEELEGFFVARAGLCGVGEDGQAGVRGELQPLEVEAELADYGVVEVLDAVDVKADVVRGLTGAKGLALRGELFGEV